MKKISFLVVLLFSASVFGKCMTVEQAANIGAQAFIDEYHGKTKTNIFDDDFHHMFYYDNHDETLAGAIEAFFNIDSEFNDAKQRYEFLSYLDGSSAHQTTGHIFVTCDGKVTSYSHTEHD